MALTLSGFVSGTALAAGVLAVKSHESNRWLAPFRSQRNWAKWDQADSLETLLGFEETAYLAIFGWLAIAGPGAFSLDHLLKRWLGERA